MVWTDRSSVIKAVDRWWCPIESDFVAICFELPNDKAVLERSKKDPGRAGAEQLQDLYGAESPQPMVEMLFIVAVRKPWPNDA